METWTARQVHLKVAIQQIEEFYGDERAPLPLGVRPSRRRDAGARAESTGTTRGAAE